VFDEPYRQKQLKVTLYRPDKLKLRAVVSGFKAKMDTLNRQKVGKKFMPGNFDIVMSEVRF